MCSGLLEQCTQVYQLTQKFMRGHLFSTPYSVMLNRGLEIGHGGGFTTQILANAKNPTFLSFFLVELVV